MRIVARLMIAPLVAFAAVANAQDVGVTIIEHGLYTAETVRTERLANGFNSNIVQNICHVVTADAVPMRIGVQFGYRFRVDGAPVGAIIELRRVTRFPAPMTPPGGSAAQSVSEHGVRVGIGATSYVGYGFDHPWELVRGPWALELWHGDRMLARQQFEIGDGELPADRPRSGDNCFRLSVSLPGFTRTGGTP